MIYANDCSIRAVLSYAKKISCKKFHTSTCIRKLTKKANYCIGGSTIESVILSLSILSVMECHSDGGVNAQLTAC